MVFVVALNWLSETLAGYIPFAYEQDIAAAYTEKMKSSDDLPVRAYLQDLANHLVTGMDLPKDMTITVHYSDTDTVNAFATLGGHIFIFRGLLQATPNENALAMVMAHEIAHIKHRDPIVAMGRGVLLSSVLAVVTGASGQDMAGRILGSTGLLTTLHFSRSQEQAADTDGLGAIARYYGHVNGATSIFEQFMQDEKNNRFGLPAFMQTHPASKDRIDRLHALALAHGWPEQGELMPLPTY